MAPPAIAAIAATSATTTHSSRRSASVSKAMPPTRTVSFRSNKNPTNNSSKNGKRQARQQPRASSTSRAHLSNTVVATHTLNTLDNDDTDNDEIGDDPEVVARAVLSLRESRQSAAHRKSLQTSKKKSSQHRHASAPRPHAYHSHKPQSSPEEDRARKTIQTAETRIDGLLQELEDLRFLEELDAESATNNNHSNHNNDNHHRSKSVPKGRLSSSSHVPKTVRMTKQQSLSKKGSSSSRSPRHAINSNSCSNNNNNHHHANATQPPPPPPPGLDELHLPSPRTLSKLDRMNLELETQTLCRRVQTLTQEKLTLEKAVEMYELSLQDAEHQQTTIADLERQLTVVQKQLQTARHDWSTVKQNLIDDYQEQLNVNIAKLQKTQQVADNHAQKVKRLSSTIQQLESKMAQQVQSYQDDMNSVLQSHERELKERNLELQQVADLADDFHQQVEQEKKLVSELQQKLTAVQTSHANTIAHLEGNYKQQTTSHARVVQQLEDDLADRQAEIDTLKSTIQNTNKSVQRTQQEKDSAHKVRLDALQVQLSLKEEQMEELQCAHSLLQQQHATAVRDYESQSTEQNELLSELTDRLDRVHAEYRDKFAELKDMYEQKEARKLTELIQAHAKEKQAVEQRHTAQVQTLQDDSNAHLQKARCDLQTLRQQYEHQTVQVDDVQASYDRLSKQYSDLQATLETTIVEHDSRQVESSNKVQQLTDECASHLKTIDNQDDQIVSLKEQLEQSTKRYESKVKSLQEQHRQEAADKENFHQTKLTRVVHELEQQTEQHQREEATLKAQVSKLEEQLQESRHTIDTERQRGADTASDWHLQVSSLEGKLRACESTIQQKTETIQSLQEKVATLTVESRQHCNETDTLRKSVESVNALLLEKKSTLAAAVQQHETAQSEKESTIQQLRSNVSAWSSQVEDIQQRLRDSEASYQQVRNERVAEQTRHERVEEQFQVDLATLQGKLRASEASLMERRDAVNSLERKLQRVTDSSTASTKELQNELDRVKPELKETKLLLEKIRAELSAKDELLKQQQRKLRENNGIIAALEEKLTNVSTNEHNYSQSARSLRSALDQSKIELASERIKTKNSEAELRRELESVKDKLRVSEQTAVMELEIQTRSSADEGIALSELQRTMTSLREDLDRTSDQLRQERENVQLKNDQIEELQDCLNEKESTIDSLQSKLSTAQATGSSSEVRLRGEINILQSALDEANDQLSRKRAALESRTAEFEKLSSLHHDVLKKADQLEGVERTIVGLQTELASVQAGRSERTHEISVLRETSSLADSTAMDDLQSSLTVEQKRNEEMKSRVAELEADLEIKQQQLHRLPSLQSQLKDLVEERSQLQSQLANFEKQSTLSTHELQLLQDDLEEKDNLIDSLQQKLTAAHREKRELQSDLDASTRELSRQRELLAKAQASASLLQYTEAAVDDLTKSKASLESKIRELEEDRQDRESQVKQSSDRFSNQILELQMKVEELTQARASLKSRLSRAESDIEQKEELMSATSSQFSGDISSLRSKLSEQLAENDTLKSQVDRVQRQLKDMETAEQIQAKLDAESKEKRSLLAKLGDIEEELARKEKQVKGIVDRYTKEIADLNHKLEDEERSKNSLKRNIENLKNSDLSSASAAVLEAKIARDQFEKALLSQRQTNASLQKEIEQLKSELGGDSSTAMAELRKAKEELEVELEVTKKESERKTTLLEDQAKIMDSQLSKQAATSARRLDDKDLDSRLANLEKAKVELETRLKKVNSERTEVIAALEDVINEVQSREDEIEQLTNILEKRDEELEHAKMIATKALASAQELKARYKAKSSDRKAEQRVTELQSHVDFLTEKNETLQRKTSKLETALQERKIECTNLKKRVKKLDPAKSSNDKDSVFSKESLQKFDDEGFPTFDTSSPTQIGMSDTMSTQSADRRSGWLHDFDSSGSTDSGSHATEPAENHASKRTIEQSALRKYVRSRYMKSRGSLE